MSDTLKQDALDYHRYPTPGKISVTPTKAMATQRDLGLAYSPGVAEACLAIAEDPREAGNLTARNNLVAVITNGTAVLGLGNIGALAGKGVLFAGREGVDESKARYAQETRARTLADACEDADVFLGLSSAGVLKPEMVKTMARDPIILAMANPTPEIMPEEALAVRPDAILGTGRSDYPNQINNVLCFPFIFRGALDVGATTINEEMKLATVRAIADLAHAEIPESVAKAYGAAGLRFGRDYLIPKPFDPRLIEVVAPAVARAAMDSGVATRPIADIEAYRGGLARFVYRSGSVMQPVFAAAQKAPKRVVYAEGEDERVLRAVQIVVDEGLAWPILVGRPSVVEQRIQDYGLRLAPGRDFELVDPDTDSRLPQAAQAYYQLTRRKGVTPLAAESALRRNPTALAAMLVHRGEADALLCGMWGGFRGHLDVVADVIGLRQGVETLAAMNMLMLAERTLFICDTHVNYDPSPQQLAEIAVLAADGIRRFGVVPHAALLSHSSFGSEDTPSARKMRRALELIRSLKPRFEVEGEMHGDAALSKELLDQVHPGSALTRDANLLVMPTLDAANITFNVLKATAGHGITVGPILLGLAQPAHILTPTATVRRIVNMSALASVDCASEWSSRTATSVLLQIRAGTDELA